MSGIAVAKTIASDFTNLAIVTQTVVLAALIGASMWNLMTWWLAIPSSSSHALIGGFPAPLSPKPALAHSSKKPATDSRISLTKPV